MKLEDRKAIINEYATLVNLINTTEPNTNPGELMALAETCAKVLVDMPQQAPVQRFHAALDALAKGEDFKPACATLAAELTALPGLWLYERSGDNWEIIRIDGDETCDTLAMMETEGLVDRLISLYDTPGQPIPQILSDDVPAGYRIEQLGECWECYRTPEPLDDEDEPEEEWYASVVTETLALALSASMAGTL